MSRIDKLLHEISERGAEAALLHSPESIRYFTGFTGEGYAFVCGDTKIVVTDSRYTEAAANQAIGWKIEGRSFDKFLSVLIDQVRALGIKAITVEDDFLPVTDYREIHAAVPTVQLVSAAGVGVKIRSIKDADEIAKHKKAAQITDQVFQYALKVTKPGMSEIDLVTELTYYMSKEFKANKAFDYIVASGTNGSMPHAVPTTKLIEQGDMVTLDFGAEYDGYKADMTRTYAVGKPADKLVEIYHIVQEAQRLASEALKPGVSCKAIDAVARDYIAQKGYGSCFGHGLGHGVGLQIHEQPRLSLLSTAVLEPGMIVTVEPGIYLPGIGGVRIEDTCLITENGWESLFTSDKSLIIL